MTILNCGVFLSLAISVVLLTVEAFQTLGFGRPRLHSEPRGSRLKGVAYAFGRGMMPWEKESAARHLPTYGAGILYHGGIFAAVLAALVLASGLRVAGFVRPMLEILMAAGFLAGAGLLIKRAVKPVLRHISCPDDFIANLLVDLFILCGLLALRVEAVVPVFLAVSIVAFLYMPLGKIRHCVFFFYSRILFGSYFGRRGVLPGTRRAEPEVRR